MLEDMNTNNPATNAVDLVKNLDPDAIAARLEELDREMSALRVLLRAVRVRKSAARRRAEQAQSQAVVCAS